MDHPDLRTSPGPGAPESARSLTRAIVLYLACIPILILLPIAIWALHLPFISNSAGPDYEVMEIFGFCVTIVIVLVAAHRLARVQRATPEALVPIVSFALVGTFFTAHTTEFLPPSAGWRLYVEAAEATLHGGNPYAVDGFIYPPFAAQALAGLHRLVALGTSIVPPPSDPDYLWKGVFYVYQAAQLLLVLGACGLGYAFGRRCGIRRDYCALLILVLFVFNIPLLRTFRNNQVNLYLLDAMLIALTVPRSALLGGIAIAIASHIKLYPMLLLVPAAVLREWRLIVWTTIAVLAILLIQTHGGVDFEMYRQYIASIPSFPTGSAFRDNSIHSVVFNTARALTGFRDVGGLLATAATIVWLAGTAAVAVYFGIRILARERFRDAGSSASAEEFRSARRSAHMADAIAALVLLSPIVWEHHYTLLIPVAIWAIATTGARHPWLVGVGTFLMFCIPTFDVYPLSYHRLAGLAMLLWSTHPGARDAGRPSMRDEAGRSRSTPRST